MATATANLPETAAFLASSEQPSLAQVRLLRRVAEQNAYDRKALTEVHRAGLGKDALRNGILAYALDFAADAAEALEDQKDAVAKAVLSLAYASVGEQEDAIALMTEASSSLPEAKIEIARLHLDANDADAAEAILKDCPETADSEFLLGRVAEQRGTVERAISFYEGALEQDTEHVEAAFKLGVLLDRIGDDDMAIEYYLICSDVYPHYLPGVMNLGVLYDERGEANAAIACFRQVLAHNPDNKRASMLLRDAKASRTMYYDEREERERERMEKILKTSVNDFELSVRSRNCLAKMNIFTLGDLISITEQEMLNYKNFGETSLKEVKEMLDARNLRLGMLREHEDRSMTKADQKTLAESTEKLELSSRTLQVLERLKVTRIGDLMRYNDLELYRSTGSGQSVVQELSTGLGAFGLTFHQPEV
jgi:DNA-directed RNA polymerase subunit alpha